ncbi:hypothetical protein ACPXB3_08475 [Gordonia sp. DT219]|uniref:hypothetical protein n=1 Tax=Gordonia sp. DT219 TaxID=3416658 RepID=UPI003CF9AB09
MSGTFDYNQYLRPSPDSAPQTPQPVPVPQYPVQAPQQQYPVQAPQQQHQSTQTQTNSPGVPTVPAVEITGTAPSSWTGHWVFGGAAVVLLVGAIISAATGSAGGAVFLGIIGAFVLILALLMVWGATSAIGRRQVSAGPEGIWTPYFTLTWSQVRALDFKQDCVEYAKINPHKVRASRRRRTSLVITGTEVDKQGRPLQYGSTLYQFNTGNFDEFRSAAKKFAPHIGFWTALDVDDYQVDPTTQQSLHQQYAATGCITVRTRRGKEKLRIDGAGVTVRSDFVPWNAITAVIAVTDIHTTTGSSGTGGTTSRTPRLVFVTNLTDTKGKERRLRPTYEVSYQPTIEQLLPWLRQLVPHVQIADQRTQS